VIQFLVDPGRYHSFSVVVRDIHGIKGGGALQPPLRRSWDEAHGSLSITGRGSLPDPSRPDDAGPRERRGLVVCATPYGCAGGPMAKSPLHATRSRSVQALFAPACAGLNRTSSTLPDLVATGRRCSAISGNARRNFQLGTPTNDVLPTNRPAVGCALRGPRPSEHERGRAARESGATSLRSRARS
jgi:hypothetical protein